MNIDPIWINSGFLFVTGALLVAIGVLVLLLIEGRKTSAKLSAALNASMARQNALRQEHCSEIEELKQRHLARISGLSKDHRIELENLGVILSIAEQERDEALKALTKVSHATNC